MTIRVLVVDDHRVVRAGLEVLLSTFPDVDLVGTAADGADAVDLVAATRPDVVLMDLAMPGMDGIEATRRILDVAPQTKVVVLTSFAERPRVVDAVDAGAVGYLLKDAAPEDIVAAINAAHRGEAPLDPRAAKALVGPRGTAATPPGRSPGATLTDRERQVLGLVAEGLPNKLIARRLGIAEKTVKVHLTAIFQRIGVSDRTQAALWAQRNGLAP